MYVKCDFRGERKDLLSLLVRPTIPQPSPVFSRLFSIEDEKHSFHAEGGKQLRLEHLAWVLLGHWKAMCGRQSPAVIVI